MLIWYEMKQIANKNLLLKIKHLFKYLKCKVMPTDFFNVKVWFNTQLKQQTDHGKIIILRANLLAWNGILKWY